MTIKSLLRIERNVARVKPAINFYTEALGFVLEYRDDEAGSIPGVSEAAVLRLGRQSLTLTSFAAPSTPYPAGSTAADLWFQHIAIVTPDIAAAYARLCRHAHTPISVGGPQLLPQSSGGVTAYKFRDPDGHPVELIQFPPGNKIWKDAPPALTLGIDHSAISVADVEASIIFYCTTYGMKIAGRQINQGVEQEHLDGLAGVVVEVVALEPAAAATPHLELLCYKQPRGRRLALSPADIAADRLIFKADTSSDLIHDPDGHSLMLSHG